jgi:hypothetical protein
MLRNKGAHLGDDVFRYFGLFGIDGSLYSFIPRQWPYFFEEHMKPAGHEGAREPFSQFLLRTLVHEDYISFAEGLNSKIHRVVGTASEVIHIAFKMFARFELNQTALSELKDNSRSYDFEYFPNAGSPIS